MAQTKHQIEALLAEAGAEPRHRFGQNFMIDQNLVRIVADAGMIGQDDCVIEVGPGTGTLTEELLDRAAEVVAVEIDRDLAALLRNRFSERQNLRLIEGDALAGKHHINPQLLETLRTSRDSGRHIKLVANLPYNIASPLVIELLTAGVELLAFTVQKEVAARLRAKPGTEEYGPLTVTAQMLSHVEVLRTLPPQAFWPAPKIESALVRMTRENRLGNDVPAFSRFVHSIFSFRRKTLRKAMQQAGYDGEKVFRKTGFDSQLRPEAFSPDQFHAMFQAVNGEALAGPG